MRHRLSALIAGFRRVLIGVLSGILASLLPTVGGAVIIGEFPIAPLAGQSGIDSGLVAGPDGNVWFVDISNDKIGRISPSGAVTSFSLPPFGQLTGGITVGPDGNVWATKQFNGRALRMTPGGTVTEFPLSMDAPRRITAGPDGNLWFTGQHLIGRITPAGVVTHFPLPDQRIFSVGITAGPDGNLWFTGISNSPGGMIGRISPSGSITEYWMSSQDIPISITPGPDGNLWFANSCTAPCTSGSIGRITPAGVITLFPIPTSGSFSYGITTGPDGNLWFADNTNSKIGRTTPGGTFLSTLSTPSAISLPQHITTSPDGLIWFTESLNKIGVIGQPEISGFFPLTPGASWTYLENGTTSLTRSVTGTVNVNGIDTSVTHWSDGWDDYYTNDSNGIRLHRQADATTVVTFSPPLKLADALGTLTTVSSSGTASGTSSGEPFSLSYSSTTTLQGVEPVVVPAGAFRAVKAQSSITIGGVTVLETDWLANNIGLVKSIEGADTLVLTSTNRVVTTPDFFSYVVPSASPPVTANTFVVTGITAPAQVSITGGQYSINDSAFGNAPGVVSNGQSVTVRPSATPNSLLRQAVVTIGGITGVINALGRKNLHSDLNGDGRGDLLWRNAVTGENYLWAMDGLTLNSGGFLRQIADSNWAVAGRGDVNGDGRTDVLWRNGASGETYLWLMDGQNMIGEGFARTVADPNWVVVGMGDFNADGKADVLWRNTASGDVYVWLMNGLTIAGEGFVRRVADPNWVIAGTGDLDGDLKADIVWRHQVTGHTYAWLMNGTVVGGEGFMRQVADPHWTIAGIGDLNGDGKADIVWRNAVPASPYFGQNYLWQMDGLGIAAEGFLQTVADAAWNMVAFADYNGDGKTDIVWRNATPASPNFGQNYLWLMNGASIVNQGFLNTVPSTEWAVVDK